MNITPRTAFTIAIILPLLPFFVKDIIINPNTTLNPHIARCAILLEKAASLVEAIKRMKKVRLVAKADRKELLLQSKRLYLPCSFFQLFQFLCYYS